MTKGMRNQRWRTDGKFFRAGTARVRIEAVTYGPFPGGWPPAFEPDFQRIAAAGFNAIRLFEMPGRRLLDAAWHCGLRVFGGLKWGHNADFFQRPALYQAARIGLVRALGETADHPALAGVYVGNEVPADLVRWMGPLRVRLALEGLIALGRDTAPELLFAYANYPSTEYLEPENADFSAFNIYLEEPAAFRNYLKRLHHIAGDRPLVISEFGLDSRRNGCQRQAEVLAWAADIARAEETAGLTVYAWSDRWWNCGRGSARLGLRPDRSRGQRQTGAGHTGRTPTSCQPRPADHPASRHVFRHHLHAQWPDTHRQVPGGRAHNRWRRRLKPSSWTTVRTMAPRILWRNISPTSGCCGSIPVA